MRFGLPGFRGLSWRTLRDTFRTFRPALQGQARGLVASSLLTAAVVIGGALLPGVDPRLHSLLLSFAGGAVLASIADTLMPDAFREGGALVAFATAAGFFLSFMIDKV